MIGKLITSLKCGFYKVAENARFVRLCLAVFIYIVAVSALIFTELPGINRIEIGQPAPWDIKAAHSVQVIDEDLWTKAQNNAAAQTAPIEKIEPQAINISHDKLKKTISIIKDADVNAKKLTDEKISQVSQEIPLNLSNETIKALLTAGTTALDQIYVNSDHILNIVMQEGVGDSEQEQAKERIKKEAEALPGLSRSSIKTCAELAEASLVTNKFIDIQATQKAKNEARDNVEPIYKSVLSGQIVIREGDIVTEDDVPVLEALGVYRPNLTLNVLISASGLVLVMLLITRFYMRRYTPEIYANLRIMTGLVAICAVFIVISRYTMIYSIYFMPIAFPAILITIMINPRLALLIVSILGIYAGMLTSNFVASAIVILTGIISVLSVHNIQRRWDIITASIWILAVNVFSIFSFDFIGSENLEEILTGAFFYGCMNGFLPALLASGFLPILENLLKITTHIKMLELSNPSEPALHDLLTKASGTYMHSIMVANLAEAAAQTIGADSMLCRVGALYHDIGKMQQPSMFVENQSGGNNPHDSMSPSLSAMTVISHVTVGKKMADSVYKLPQEISKFITEHHGTNLASFFFQKAKMQSDEPVFAEDFSYDGPSPQSKETAIVMICDGCEAAARTLRVPNKENIANLVDKIVNGIIRNKQLDECPISLREINEVKNSVIRSLTSQYHSRVTYPNFKKEKTGSAGSPSSPAAPSGGAAKAADAPQPAASPQSAAPADKAPAPPPTAP